MHKSTVKLSVLGIMTVLLVGCIYVLGSDSTAKPKSLVAQLESSDRQERLAAAKAMEDVRAQTIASLLRIADVKTSSPGFQSARELAIQLLGEYRAVQAVPLLVKEIALCVPAIIDSDVSAAGYPCVQALVKIGIPSLEGILKRLDETAGETEFKLFATVFRLIDGEELAIIRAELALKKAEGQQKKNLEQLVELLKAKQWYF
jgi:hypothetical protein